MTLALYRKYRPQTFADLTDQVHVRVTLENEIRTGKIAHAYLFAGPRGVGKTTTARIFAKAVNCTARKGAEPCLTCDACLSIGENRAVDILEIDAASHTGVDAVRENIIESVRFTPTQLAYKVFIIDEVHMLSTAAFNALLKTLEEPPAHALFILATTETHKVPPTILSRCQRFDFHKISIPDLVKRLADLSAREEVDVDPAVLAEIARAGGGSVRDAESLLGQVLALGEKRITRDEAALVLPHSDLNLARAFLEHLRDGRGGDALRLIDRLIVDGVDLSRFVDDALRLLRLAMLAALGESSGLADLDEANAAFVAGPLAGWGVPRILAAIETMLTAAERVKRGDGSPLPLEIAAATLLVVPDGRANAASPPTPYTLPPTPPPARKIAIDPKAQTEELFSASAIPDIFATTNVGVENFQPLRGTNSVPTPETRPPTRSPSITIPLETFQARWKELISSVGDVNHSLPFVLDGSKPQAVEGDRLIVGVPFAFHRDRLNDLKNRMLIEEHCEKLFGCRISFEGAVVDGLQNPASDVSSVPMDDPIIKNVLDAFGGRVVS